MIEHGCTKRAIVQLFLASGSSKLEGEKQKCYCIRICSCFLSVNFFWREIRPNAGTTTGKEFVAAFFKKWIHRQADRVEQISCTADKKACVFGSFDFLKTLFRTFTWLTLFDMGGGGGGGDDGPQKCF